MPERHEHELRRIRQTRLGGEPQQGAQVPHPVRAARMFDRRLAVFEGPALRRAEADHPFDAAQQEPDALAAGLDHQHLALRGGGLRTGAREHLVQVPLPASLAGEQQPDPVRQIGKAALRAGQAFDPREEAWQHGGGAVGPGRRFSRRGADREFEVAQLRAEVPGELPQALDLRAQFVALPLGLLAAAADRCDDGGQAPDAPRIPRRQLQPSILYWTSRGIAVVDVDYRGSTGYGRPYRRALDGGWGEIDVADCAAAARHLVDRGEADPERLIIRGSSAGGLTVLAALALHDTFAAGASRYGVADLTALAADTHKFESRYLDTLVGPYPEARRLYEERSPINHVDSITAPLIVLQGSEDAIVPPDQSSAIVAALESKGVPVAYLLFEGEQHGFRRAETIVAALESELAFFGRVLGFNPADTLPPIKIRGLDDRQFGAMKGRSEVDDRFFEPLPEDELAAWEK